MKGDRHSKRKQLREDIRFICQVGKIMLQWEQQRGTEVDKQTFLIKPEVQERVEMIQQYIQNAKIPPVSCRYEFNAMYNQISITIEEYVFSDYSYPLHEILGAVDTYGMDAMEDGHIILSMGICDAAYELEE